MKQYHNRCYLLSVLFINFCPPDRISRRVIPLKASKCNNTIKNICLGFGTGWSLWSPFKMAANVLASQMAEEILHNNFWWRHSCQRRGTKANARRPSPDSLLRRFLNLFDTNHVSRAKRTELWWAAYATEWFIEDRRIITPLDSRLTSTISHQINLLPYSLDKTLRLV